MGVYELSGAGSLKTGRTLYTSMNANNQFGAMVPIASYTAASTGGFSFTNIPQNYQDLMIVFAPKDAATSGTSNTQIIFNLDTNTIYSSTRLLGDGSSATSDRNTGLFYSLGGFVPTSATGLTSVFGAVTYHILNYTNTSTFKTVLQRSANDQNGSGYTSLVAGLYRSTAAITTVTLNASNVGMTTGTTATIYGIRAVSS